MRDKVNKNFIMVSVVYFLVCVSWQLVNALIISFGIEILNTSMLKMASVASVVSIAGLVIRPFSGIMADCLNQKILYIVSLFLYFFSMLGFVLCSNYIQLYGFQIIRGISWAFIILLGQYIVSKSVAKENLGFYISLYMIGSTVANIFGSGAALYLLAFVGYQNTFLIAALTTLIGIGFATQIKMEFSTKKLEFSTIELKDIVAVKTIPIAFYAFIFQIFTIVTGAGFVIAFARGELGIENIGMYAAIMGIIGIVSRPAMGRLYDQHGGKHVLLLSAGGYVIACGILAFTQSYFHFICAAVVLGTFTMGFSPILQAEAVKKVSGEFVGAATSTKSIGADIGYVAGSMIFAFITDTLGSYRYAYLSMSIISVFCLLIILVFYDNTKQC